MDEQAQDEQARQLVEELVRDPELARQKFAFGCALTVAVMKLWQSGMQPADVHDVVDMSTAYVNAQFPPYQPRDPNQVSSVWVYLVAHAVTKSLELGTTLDEVHQMVEVNMQVASAAQAQMREVSG